MKLGEYWSTIGLNKRFDIEWLYGMTGKELIGECSEAHLNNEVVIDKEGEYDLVRIRSVVYREITPLEYEIHNLYWKLMPPYPEPHKEEVARALRMCQVAAEAWRMKYDEWALGTKRAMPPLPDTCGFCHINKPTGWIFGRKDIAICDTCGNIREGEEWYKTVNYRWAAE